jgi:DNA (cytosine-5)-methyltransferase 1
MSLRFGSVCSGIEAASVAWEPLGWRAAWFSEIEPFPSAVLAHHYPATPNHGDMTALPGRIRAGDVEAPDLLCGGTPCQAFSVAGLRRSLDDARGNLTLTFVEIADAIDAVRRGRGQDRAIVFWENVPGVLNTEDNAFGCFLAALAGEDCALKPAGRRWTDAGCVLGPKRAIAWRVLDAQYFGLAQRRRRVFVVAGARNGFNPAAVLFESDGLRRDIAPSREARQGVADTASLCFAGNSESDVAATLETTSHDYSRSDSFNVVAHAFDARQSDVLQYGDKTGPLDTDGHTIDVCVTGNRTHALTTRGAAEEDGTGRGVPITAFVKATSPHSPDESPRYEQADVAACLNGWDERHNPPKHMAVTPMAVRRLTPRECERLQGFPDDHTVIPWRGRPAADCPDGPRYKALGNSWAVPVVRWIGTRIDAALRSTP